MLFVDVLLFIAVVIVVIGIIVVDIVVIVVFSLFVYIVVIVVIVVIGLIIVVIVVFSLFSCLLPWLLITFIIDMFHCQYCHRRCGYHRYHSSWRCRLIVGPGSGSAGRSLVIQRAKEVSLPGRGQ